jgi:hypothetical protein
MKWKFPNLIWRHLAGPFQGRSLFFLVFCEAAAMILPGWQPAHSWLALFSTAEVGGFRNMIDGIIFSMVFGWITAVVMVSIYNRLVRR